MTPSVFIERARRLGCRVDVSGSITFVSDGLVTVRIDASGAFFLRHIAHGQDMRYMQSTAQACSRALGLPRK